jgi:hypothetical protein
MIMLIPITIRMPAMLVFVPPAMVGVPAMLTHFVQHSAPALRLLTPVTVMLDGFVQLVIGFRNAPLAVIIGAQSRRAEEHHTTGQYRGSERGSSKKRIQYMSHER